MKQILAFLLAGVLGLTLLISLNASQRRSAAAELSLSETAKAAVAQTAAELETLTLSLEKLLVTTSPRQQAKQLSALTVSADRAQISLCALPDSEGQRGAVLAYLSRLSHLAQTALADLAEGDGFHTEVRSDLSSMLDGMRLLQAELAIANSETLTGERAADVLPASEVTAPPSALEMVDYKALPSREISAGEAMEIAKAFVGEEKVISVTHAPDTAGALPAYGVTVQTPDLQLNLEITRRGGKVLLMVPETASFAMLRTPEQCAASALSFLNHHGFAEMEVAYYEVYDGLCVLTCVYSQSGVLVWPDRVLVQVRMDTDGELILTLYDRELEKAYEFETPVPVRKGARLDILVENMGRVNYSYKMIKQRKGIDSAVVINNHQHYGWDIYRIDEPAMLSMPVGEACPAGQPGVYEMTFDVDVPADTWLELPGWGKGVVLLNGFSLGRFWEVGPQKRLYIPAPLLKEGTNTLRIIESEGKSGPALLVDEPSLG